MACWVTTSYKIYPGNNQAGNLALVTSYTDTSSVAFIEPGGIPHARRGSPRTRSNGTTARVGFASIDWIFGWMTFKQWEYAKNNWEGLVTIKAAANSSTFANYNAVLRLDDPADMTFGIVYTPTYSGGAWINAPLHFTHLEAL